MVYLCVKVQPTFTRFFDCLILKEKPLPTNIQAKVSVFVCQMLSNTFQPINLFRYVAKLKTLYIQAGINDDIAIIIDTDGEWEFV